MEVVDGVMVVSPSDLVGYLACSHLTWLDTLAASGQLDRPQRDDPMLELLRARGLEHERQYLQRLAADGAEVVDIAAGGGHSGGRADRREQLRAAETRTLDAMAGGTPVVYQATFYDESGAVVWRGHADFLRRVDLASSLGQWSYEPEDTKLAGLASAGAVLQLCAYAEQVARLQGVEPHEVHVVTGDGRRTSIRQVDGVALQVRPQPGVQAQCRRPAPQPSGGAAKP